MFVWLSLKYHFDTEDKNNFILKVCWMIIWFTNSSNRKRLNIYISEKGIKKTNWTIFLIIDLNFNVNSLPLDTRG